MTKTSQQDPHQHQGDFFEDYHNTGDSALIINDGVEQQPIVNPYLKKVSRPGIRPV